jgi:RimJ/RimL family protein N-acetyltransferase
MHVDYLETERMLLRCFTADDADLLIELDSDPEVMRYLTGGEPTPPEKIREEILPRLLGHYDRWPSYGVFLAHEKAGGEFLGWFALRPKPENEDDDPELGYRLRKAAWGRGFATEGSIALVRKAFTELGARRVHAETMSVNRGSRGVMEKVGLRYVRTFFPDLPPIEGSEHGDVVYELTREGWERRRRET